MKLASRVGLLLGVLPLVASCAREGATTLQADSVRETLRSAEAGALVPGTAIISTPLVAYTFHQELRLSSGTRAFVIGANAGGGVLTTKPDGSPLDAIESGEILSFLFTRIGDSDLLLVRQVDGAGTGYREENHHLYRLSSSGVEDVWEGLAYLLEIGPAERNGTREASERRGFVDIDGGGFGGAPRLVHSILEVGTGRASYNVYTFVDGRPQIAQGKGVSRTPRN